MVDNRILVENQKTGTARTVWDAPASNQIEGFAVPFSVNHGSTISFKINLNVASGTAPYRIEIYRLGYYGGSGATLVTTISGLAGGAQPNPVTDARGLTDAGNWTVSATWATPATAVSGVYLAKLVRTDNNATNQIPFVVRDDSSHSDIVFQTSDTTWHAYNGWAGRNGTVGASLYGNFPAAPTTPDESPVDPDRAFAVSYNRPFVTRDGGGRYAGGQDYLFGAEDAAISFLERYGFDVTYIGGVDTDRIGAAALNQHKTFLSVGHDEYWSGDQRANVEAARDAGLNLQFWSGNEVYWKTRWENSIVDGADRRTLVCYKETRFNNSVDAGPADYPNMDPNNQWTGTWRDTRFADAVGPDGVTHVAVGARPENSLTGQSFIADGTGQFGAAIDVPAAYAVFRQWRNTGVGAGGAQDLCPGILGYEWDQSPIDDSRPASLVRLSETTSDWLAILVDNGNTTEPGTATHNLSLYRAPSGALVFGAGTVFWSWALSNDHDSSPYGATIASSTLQQFTLNMLADMGCQPACADSVLTAQGLSRASASTDVTPATATLNTLPASVAVLTPVIMSGSASDVGGRVVIVEVSLDGGATWKLAQGTTSWTYSWLPTAVGTYTIKVRAIDDSLNLPANNTLATQVVTVTSAAPGAYSLFDPAATPTGQVFDDGQAVELGVKFQTTSGGVINALRYYRATADAGDTDVRAGHLWAADGALLATATFNSAPGQTGWQVATLTTPVTVLAGTTYVASYNTSDNYLVASNYFTNTVTGPGGGVTAPSSSSSGGNGVFAYGSGALFPDQSFEASNYWVDVVFAQAAGAGSSPSTPDLAAASDTGASSTDNITSDSTPTLVGTATAGSTVKVLEGATVLGTATADGGGNWSVTTSALADGAHSLTATATTSGGTSAPSGALTVTIDTTPPPAPSTPDMTAASDDGASNTDNSTSVATPTFTGTVASAPGATVTLLEGSTVLGTGTADASGNWSVTSSALSVGVHAITARATDVAGNVGAASAALSVTITAPAATISLFGATTPTATMNNDGSAVELGVKFKATTAGTITALRYYRAAADAGDTDTRVGHLWSSSGTLLATATFTSTSGQSGWQTATLSTPVAIQAGVTYVASYKTADNYLSSANYFANAVTDPTGVLSAPSSTQAGGNGVYAYGSATTFPNQTFQASNYWIDVVFAQ